MPSDVAYYLDKYDHTDTWIINIWGSNHHGYLQGKAAMEASEKNVEKLEVVFIQFANLIRGRGKSDHVY